MTHPHRRPADYGSVHHFITAESCPTGKRLYPNRAEAKRAARAVRDRNGQRERLDAYRCRDGCDGFHIGHHYYRGES